LSFSPDGNYFVLFFKKLNILQIFEIYDNNLEDLIDRIDQGEEPLREYTSQNEGDYLKGFRTLKWSPKSDYMIIFGYEKLAIIDFTDEKGNKFEII
jgi:hypothetical protein